MEPCSTLCCGLRSLRLWNQIKCPEQGLHLCDATSEPARGHWSPPALTLTLKVPQSPVDLGRVGVAAGASAPAGGSSWGSGPARVGRAGTQEAPCQWSTPISRGASFVPLLPETDTLQEQPPHLLFTGAMASSVDMPTAHQSCRG